MPPDGAEIKISVWESIGLSEDKTKMLAAAVGAIVLALIAVIALTPAAKIDEAVQPVSIEANERKGLPRPDAAADQAPQEPTPGPVVSASTPAVGRSALPAVDSHRAGAAAFREGKFEEARAAFEQGLARNPEDAEMLNNLGQTLEQLGRTNEAIARFERAVALVPGRSAYHFNLAHAAGQRGSWDRAVAEYREAVRLSPADSAAQYNLALAIKKQGDEHSAITEFQKAIALAPGEPSFHLSLGRSLEQVGRVADAVKEYRVFLEMAPTAPDAAQLKTHVNSLAERVAKPPSER